VAAAQKDPRVTRDEILKLENYLKRVFRSPGIQVRQRPQKDDSAEVYVDEEFIGVLFRDDEDEGETAYQFQMAILDFDLQ
jgi:Protein of unknown function (DUF3126)